MLCCTRNETNKPEQNTNNFIVKHVQNNKQNDRNIGINFDQRRVVFISLIGAYQTWKECPSVVLHMSIFLVPLKRDWIYNPDENRDELYVNFVHPLASVSDEDGRKKFMELLRWKDSQNLVFWMEGEWNFSDKTLVHPFWNKLSNALTKLYDPITCTQYNPLCLDSNLWKTDDVKVKYLDKFGIKTSSILSEIYLLSMKFKLMQAIIYESNPKSLHPVKYYGDNGLNGISAEHSTSSNDNDEEDWWMSCDYDPEIPN